MDEALQLHVNGVSIVDGSAFEELGERRRAGLDFERSIEVQRGYGMLGHPPHYHDPG